MDNGVRMDVNSTKHLSKVKKTFSVLNLAKKLLIFNNSFVRCYDYVVMSIEYTNCI